MDSTKDKLKKVLDFIIERKDDQAKLELKKIIHDHPKYIAYRKQLAEMGLDYNSVLVEDKTYDDIKCILDVYPVPVRLQVLDVVYKEIKDEN